MTHPTCTRTPWLSKLFGRGLRTPIRRARQTRLGFECLEERLVPTEFQDVGGLRFLTPNHFSVDGGNFSLSGRLGGDSVSIGFTPKQDEEFAPLLQIEVSDDPNDESILPGSFVLAAGAEKFSTSGKLKMNLVAQGGAAIPIFSQSQTIHSDPIIQEFSIPNLLGFGVTITATNSQPSAFAVLNWVNLQMTGLALSHDDDGSGRVGIQGTGTIKSATGVDLSKVGFIKDLVVKVEGENYVYADKDGITATGFEGDLQFNSPGYEVGGYTVTGEVVVGYSDTDDGKRITIGGGVNLTAPANEGFKLEGVSGSIEVSLGWENGAPKFYGLTVDVNGSFTAGGLSVHTVNGFGFSYNFDGPQWEIFGGIDFTLKDKAEVVVELGTQADPGLVIKDGKLNKFKGSINADFNLGPVVISSSPSGGLEFSYDSNEGQFEMSGGLGIKVGSGSKQFTINATLGDATDPGIIYIPSKGGLQQANFGVTGQLSVGSLSFNAQDAGFRWVKATDTEPESWEIHGGFGIDFKAFEVSVTLGTTAKPGIKVDGDGFQLDGITVELDNISRGPLKLEELKVSYKKDGDSYDVDLALTLGIGSFVVDTKLEVIKGQIDSIEVSFLNPDGIPIGETGVNLISVDVAVKNIENPSQIAVVGKVGVVYGKTISMLGKSVNLFSAEGDLTVDKNEFILDCTAHLGAYSDDGGRTWQGVLGSGEAKLNLNWQTEIYSLHIEADGVMGVFDIKGDLVFEPGRDIQLLAEADVVIPSWVPFIGGKELGGFGFYFEHVFAHDVVATSTTFAAWIDIEIIWTITVGFELVIDGNGNSNWSLIGADQVNGFKQSVAHPGPRTFTYTTDLAGLTPAGATSLLAQVDWSKGSSAAPLDGPPTLRVQRTLNGKTDEFQEKDFADNGISIIGDGRLTGSKSVTIQIANAHATDPYQPLQGDYAILVDVLADVNPFPDFPSQTAADRLLVAVTGHVPQPIFGPVGGTAPVAPVVPSAPAGTFPVTVTGNADESFLAKTKVSLYLVSSADPFRRPVLVRTVAPRLTGGSGWAADFQVPIDNLSAVPYTLIAVVDDGHSPPVSSAPSLEFTPSFAVHGTVTNQNGTPITAVPVFLDYNGNFIQDANEPSKMTGPNGYAFTATFPPATGWDSVPVNKSFQVVLPTLINRVGDSGFETPKAPFKAPADNEYYWYNPTYDPATQPWTFSPQNNTNGSGISANGSGFSNPDAPEGTQVAFLQGTGSISQTVNLDAGSYRLSFQAVQRLTNIQTFDVKVTDSSGTTYLLNSFQPSGGSYQAYTTGPFTVPAGSYTIEFVGTNKHVSENNDNTAFIDAVRVLPTSNGGNIDPVATPTVTFDGTSPVNQPFAVKEHTAIKGVVYDDTDSNGNPTAGQPVAGAVVYLDTNGNGVRDGGEPTAVTDAGGGYAFTDLPAGAYNVRVDMSTVARITPAEAYVVPTGTAGTGTGPLAGKYTYGLSFTTERPVVVTSLGVFDDNSDGLTTTLTAVLYDADTQGELARMTFTPSNPGILVGGTRYLDLPSPIILPPGFNGMIAAYGFGATADRAGVASYLPAGAKTPWVADGGAGRLSFGRLVPNPLEVPPLELLPKVRVSGSTAISPNTYPTIPDYAGYFAGGATSFAAGSFLYRDIPWAPSPKSPAEYVVTLDGSKYDLAEGKDLGLLPPTLFFGTVTGDPLVNGQPQASAPQTGWAVGLLADRVAVAINVGGANALGFVADAYFDVGQIATTTAGIDTSRVADAPAAAVYQVGRAGQVGVNGGGFTYVIPGLNPGNTYTLRLHFAEIDGQVQVPGQRKFNAALNGTQVLFDFDIVAAAGAPNTAYARDFPVTADSFGRITLAFTAGSAYVPLVNAIQMLPPATIAATPKLAIDSGGNGGDGFLADQYVTGGVPAYVGNFQVDYYSRTLTPVSEPNYQTYRTSATANPGDGFTYTLPGLEPGRSYTVRLHFAEFVYENANGRKFNVDINGRRALTEFDIIAATSQWFTGYSADFETTANDQGRIVVAFTNGSTGVAQVNALQVFEPAGLVDTATTDGQGNYALVGYGAEEYTVVESPPPGWQQLAPEITTPTFAPTPMVIVGPNGIPSTSDAQWAAADFNGDGRMDVVVASLQPRDGTSDLLLTTVLYNQPDGSFKAQQVGAVAYTNSVPLVTVGDFNDDHRPDLAFLHSGLLDGGARNGTYVYVFLNTGDATNPFDGFQDLAKWNPIKVRPGDVNIGNGEFYSAMASEDFDGDGRDDLVLGTSLGYGQSARMVHVENVAASTPSVTSYTLPNAQGVPSYYDTHPYAIRALSVTDADADGDRDVVMLTVVHSDTFDPGYGYGHPVLAVAYRDGAGWHGPITGNQPSNVQTVTGMAVVPPRPGQPPTLIATTPIYTVDTTTTAAYNESSFRVLTGLGNGSVSQDGVNLPEQGQPKAAAANPQLLSGPRLVDVNGDGLPDLVNLFAPTMASQAIAIRINNDGLGAAMFDWATQVLLPLPANLTQWVGDFEVADFDGDGLADILVATGPTGGILFRNVTPPGRPGHSVFATAGEAVTGLNFHSAQTPAKSAVHGRVFEDANRNGARETGDKGLAGTVVFADLNGNRKLDAGEPQATTTASGHYVLPVLADGTYSIGVLPDADWKATQPAGEFTEVNIANGAVTTADFGRARRLIGAVEPQTVGTGEALDVTVPLAAAAAGHRLLYSLEGTVPAGMTIHPATGRLTWTSTGAQTGAHTVTIRAADPFDTRITDTRQITVVVPPVEPRLAVGGAGQVRVFDINGAPRFTRAPFSSSYRGAVRVATGDVNGDGVADVIAARGAGGGGQVVVFDGATGAEIARRRAFGSSYRGGVFVAAGDVNGDGNAEVIVGSDVGQKPRVRVLRGTDLSVQKDFLAFQPSNRRGVRVAAGDINGDGKADVIVGAGRGGPPRVAAFDGATGAKLADFLAYRSNFTGGVFVAAGDVNGDGRADVVTSPGAGLPPRVRVYDGAAVAAGTPSAPVVDLLFGRASERGGARVSVKPADDDHLAELVVGSGNRGRVTVYELPPDEAPDRLFDLDVLADLSGVFVG